MKKVSSIQAMLKNWKTSLLGIVPLIGAIAIGFGWIDLEQQTAIVDGIEVVFNSTDNILNEVGGGMASIISVALLFAKDADKSSAKIGIE